jgi:hypothetical protein
MLVTRPALSLLLMPYQMSGAIESGSASEPEARFV